MNFTLHHFRKEASHVRLRWLLWLVLLALQMAVNLEWIAPMPPDFKVDRSVVNPFWLFLVRPVVWGVAFWLVVSCAPEDRPGNPERFLGARPLPLRSYLLGRVLTFLALIVVPFGVQEALYLWFSDRPWNEILSGAGEAAFRACAFLGWWIPFSLLCRRRREVWLSLGVVLAALFVAWLSLAWAAKVTSEKLIDAPDPLPVSIHWLRHAVQWPGWFFVGAVILSGVAWRHLSRGWKLGLRLAAVFVIVAGTLLLILHVPLPNPATRPTAQAEVDRLAPGLQPAFTKYKLQPSRGAQQRYDAWVKGEMHGFPAEYTPHWRRQKVVLSHGSDVITTTRSEAPGFDTAFHPWQDISVQGALSSFFPKDTLWRAGPRWGIDRGADAGRFRVPDSWTRDRSPISVEGAYAIDWLKWEKEADLPAVAGSTLTTAGTRWTVLAVDDHRSSWGDPTSGMVSVTLRLEHRAQGLSAPPWDWTQEFVPVLHAPHLGLVFSDAWKGDGAQPQNAQPQIGVRAESSAWQRRIFRVSWPKALAPLGPVQKADEGKLRLVVLRRSYAGTSMWEGSLPPMTLPDSDSRIEQYPDSVQEDESFLARLRELPELGENTTLEEAQRYLATVMDILRPTFRRPWAGRLDLVVERLEPMARLYPSLLLKTGDQRPWPEILGKLAAFPQMQKAILTEMPVKPWLATVVDQSPEWQPLLREQAPMIMSTVPPLEGRFFANLFMNLRDPAHVPWLIKVMEASADEDLYLHCRSFPEHREAADAAARRAALASIQESGPFVGNTQAEAFRGLALGLRAGIPEVLQLVQHLARVMTAEERDGLLVGGRVSEAFGLPRLTMFPPGVQEKDRAWLAEIAALGPEELRFDEEARVWQPVAPPRSPATPQR
ncbi:hypothetical protein DES53_109261 [Roseimicrobium gellanilyticum]|uniref:Uncharacterized protein n=1 Tax=Roseimicrobium gellanilyticum TaxID=748857 RepID=A0A366HBV9_9BACT|nr:hypothetical protein [Roseimicrobium gellanilyticum]RBP39833.1 hypothetical protein DES53_109261 [Roseimicrobium gellanilyticum]